ncbi:MAG TPA: phosphatase PAP2 family protein [Jatrophihabitantaceae bacterium]|nr:phosphatase PAP2 family protein [Jatrophihabitantaceae bacterium]
MHNIALTWQQSAALAGALFVIAFVLRQVATRWTTAAFPFVAEIGMLSLLYALWQLAGTLSLLGTNGAFARARWLVRVEHDLHLPSEARVQHLVLHHPLLVQACNLYYASMHFGVLFVFLLWLFLRHRDDYRSVRLTLVLLTATCLVIQLVPVAPPRLLPAFVDTAAQYNQSVYSLGLGTDQLSAMPSVHVGWAVLVAWAVIRLGRSRWRWLVVLHPLATVFVITATANHFWLDGLGAVAVLILCVGAQRFVRRLRSSHQRTPETDRADRQAVAVLP